MKRIYKYELRNDHRPATIRVPAGSKILSVENQNESIVCYALVNTLEMQEMCYTFYIIHTGEAVPSDIDEFSFLGTVMCFDKTLVYHIFYKEV